MKTYQHGETGWITETDVELKAPWFEIKPYARKGLKMEAKFTPGPWKVDGISVYGVAPANVRPHIAKIIYGGSADAHLIAAAPDLYEALRQIVKRCEALKETYPEDAGLWHAMTIESNAAIAKAEGR